MEEESTEEAEHCTVQRLDQKENRMIEKMLEEGKQDSAEAEIYKLSQVSETVAGSESELIYKL